MTPKIQSRIRLALPAALLLTTAVPALPQRGPGAPRGPVATVSATAEETRWLTFMREEEKLARDVYRFLHERWSLQVFDRVAASEQQHFATVGTLLTRYAITDPAANDVPGVYADKTLAALYAELTAKGSQSLKDALEVGVLIETRDIADLETASAATTKLDLKRVFNNLMTASFNHLDAFEANLEILAALQ